MLDDSNLELVDEVAVGGWTHYGLHIRVILEQTERLGSRGETTVGSFHWFHLLLDKSVPSLYEAQDFRFSECRFALKIHICELVRMLCQIVMHAIDHLEHFFQLSRWHVRLILLFELG